MSADAPWPELTGWADTRDTLHLWTQIVGKVEVAFTPLVNHWWQVSLRVSGRGLVTPLLHVGDRGLQLEFDFVDHQLRLTTTDGRSVTVALEPRSVADFYAATLAALAELDVHVRLHTMPNEIPNAIPFDEDEVHRSYDADAARRFWLALVRMHEVFLEFRSQFVGKHSPVQFFWGGFDLASTRFSGRTAPKHPGGVPNCPDWVQELAYSHEVSSCGYWPAAGSDGEGAFYAYAYPTPQGFVEWQIEPADAAFDTALGEFLLPYASVRTAKNPRAHLLTFLQSSYDAAATLAHWDRAALESRARLPS